MKKYNKTWFTLIEVIVWITIFSIIIVSIVTTLVLNTDINNKIDISRVMKENIWNIVDQINTKTINTKNKLWVVDDSGNCKYDENQLFNSYNDSLCISNDDFKIYLDKKVDDDWIKTSQNDDCEKDLTCSIVLKDKTWKISPITNEWITFTSLKFKISDNSPQRVSIYFEGLPARKKWLRESLRQSNKVNFQTTLAQRVYNYQ